MFVRMCASNYLSNVARRIALRGYSTVKPKTFLEQVLIFRFTTYDIPRHHLKKSFCKFGLVSAHVRLFAVKAVKVPKMGDSISEGTLNSWEKKKGEYVNRDELVAVIDTDKVAVDVHSPEAGVIVSLKCEAGATVMVGDDLFEVDTDDKPGSSPKNTSADKIQSEPKSTSQKPEQNTSSKSATTDSKPITSNEAASDVSTTIATKASEGKMSKMEVSSVPSKPEKKQAKPDTKPSKISPEPKQTLSNERSEEIIPLSRLRMRVAQRLKSAQNTAASLTTFNECDMGNLMALRAELNAEFVKQHGIKFGFVSAFLYASSKALKQMPQVNGYISEDGTKIVYKNYCDISVAVATKTGLLVPVVRDCDKKSIAELEIELASLAARAREGKIALEDMTGGTFTISNGGVFGSLLGTPILNQPQSSILGLHSIKERAVVVKGEIVVRPMMYLALTYDHRMLDGREAVTFLNSIKNKIEDPRKMLLNI